MGVFRAARCGPVATLKALYNVAVNARAPSLLLLFGLTGAGKSTLVRQLLARRPEARLLPDRRTLADAVVLPEAQRLLGEPIAPVQDRVERFRLTAAYRRRWPEGMARALHERLGGRGEAPEGPSIFDGLRGVEEARGAARLFPGASFLVVRASPATRVARLSGRGDAFDRLGPGRGDDDERMLRAQRIVEEEGIHYDPAAMTAVLEQTIPADRRLSIDTEAMSASEAAERVADWWPPK